MKASAPFEENKEPSTIFKVGGLKRAHVQFEKNLTKCGTGPPLLFRDQTVKPFLTHPS
jgi:hypothetical protein